MRYRAGIGLDWKIIWKYFKIFLLKKKLRLISIPVLYIYKQVRLFFLEPSGIYSVFVKSMYRCIFVPSSCALVTFLKICYGWGIQPYVYTCREIFWFKSCLCWELELSLSFTSLSDLLHKANGFLDSFLGIDNGSVLIVVYGENDDDDRQWRTPGG